MPARLKSRSARSSTTSGRFANVSGASHSPHCPSCPPIGPSCSRAEFCHFHHGLLTLPRCATECIREILRVVWHRRPMDGQGVIMMCGLPASGKTTTAARLHATLGGVLIRSCDVYRDLGISLPEWVRRTRSFTEGVEAYLSLRDAAYRE